MVEPTNIDPGAGQGCPCGECKSPWRELEFRNGDRSRSGICEPLGEIIVVRAGHIPAECPRAGEVGAPTDMRRVVWEKFNRISPSSSRLEGGMDL